MRTGRLLLASASLLLAAARSEPVTSWGNAGVTYQTYRTDAIECALSGYVTDVKDLEVTKSFVHGFQVMDRQLNGAGNGADYSQNLKLFQPNAHLDELGVHLRGIVERCLVQRGYVKFELNRSQVKQLSIMKLALMPGTDICMSYR